MGWDSIYSNLIFILTLLSIIILAVRHCSNLGTYIDMLKCSEYATKNSMRNIVVVALQSIFPTVDNSLQNGSCFENHSPPNSNFKTLKTDIRRHCE